MRLLFVVALMMHFAALSASAQVRMEPGTGLKDSKPSRYIEFPFEVDADALIRQHLADAERLDQFKKLVEALLRDPQRKIDPKLIEGLKPKDPDDQRRLAEWIKKTIQAKKPNPDELRKLQELVKPPPPDEAGPDRVLPPPDHTPPPPPVEEEPGRDFMKNVMERAQDSRLGNVLRDAPAWQKTLDNLKSSMLKPQEGPGMDLRRLAGALEKLKLPEGRWFERLGELKPARLPRTDWSPPAPPRVAMPSVGTPSLPGLSDLGTLAIWLLCLAVCAFFLWQASRWLKHSSGGRRAAPGLGPWPVDPGQIATRGDLVKAFDYLAVLTFGFKARPWNHRAVARSLAERGTPLTAAADLLASLYEEARYTEGDEALPAEQRDQARRVLTQLSGAAP